MAAPADLVRIWPGRVVPGRPSHSIIGRADAAVNGSRPRGAVPAVGSIRRERIDRFARGEDRIVVPVMGAFKVRDGLIERWRDYFDMGALKPKAA